MRQSLSLPFSNEWNKNFAFYPLLFPYIGGQFFIINQLAIGDRRAYAKRANAPASTPYTRPSGDDSSNRNFLH
jgi:hypothetical protein